MGGTPTPVYWKIADENPLSSMLQAPKRVSKKYQCRLD